MSVLVPFPVSHSSGRHCSRAYFHTQLGLNVLVVTSISCDDYSKPRFFPSKKVGTLKVSDPLSADLPCGSMWSGRGLGTRHGIIPGLPLASHDTLLTSFCLTTILMNIIFLMIHHSFLKNYFFLERHIGDDFPFELVNISNDCNSPVWLMTYTEYSDGWKHNSPLVWSQDPWG